MYIYMFETLEHDESYNPCISSFTKTGEKTSFPRVLKSNSCKLRYQTIRHCTQDSLICHFFFFRFLHFFINAPSFIRISPPKEINFQRNSSIHYRIVLAKRTSYAKFDLAVLSKRWAPHPGPYLIHTHVSLGRISCQKFVCSGRDTNSHWWRWTGIRHEDLTVVCVGLGYMSSVFYLALGDQQLWGVYAQTKYFCKYGYCLSIPGKSLCQHRLFHRLCTTSYLVWDSIPDENFIVPITLTDDPCCNWSINLSWSIQPFWLRTYVRTPFTTAQIIPPRNTFSHDP